LQIDSITAPDTAQQGEQISIDADLTNTGEVELTQDVELVLEDESNTALETKRTEQSLGGGESTTVSFSYTISETQTENITAEFSTDNETDSREIEVLEVGELQIDSITAPDTAQEGEQITASATLINTGEIDLTQEITFTVSGPNIPGKTTTITVGETVEPVVDHTFQIPYDLTGDITVTVQTADDSSSQSVAVADTTLWARGEDDRYFGNNDLFADFTADAAGSDIDVSVNMDQICVFGCLWISYEITIDGSTYQMTTDARDDLVSNTYVDLLDPTNYDETGIESELRAIRTRIDSESTVPGGNLADTGELYVEVQEPKP
jgi:hypothetical protein